MKKLLLAVLGILGATKVVRKLGSIADAYAKYPLGPESLKD